MDGVFVGEVVICEGWGFLYNDICICFLKKDGEWMKKEDVFVEIEGLVVVFLMGEWVILNFI